ncbi:MAG TPA: nucleoside triphosphate pyrophosphohydrolase, partial [Pseudonocardiaceae bacterium]|nr:nucleoside triphosphate pyrophosphohydrolase [Pseudonocardiaceae bacterium]
MTVRAAAGSAVVLVDVRLGAVLPAAALPVVCGAAEVYAGTDLPPGLAAELGAGPAPATPPL